MSKQLLPYRYKLDHDSQHREAIMLSAKKEIGQKGGQT